MTWVPTMASIVLYVLAAPWMLLHVMVRACLWLWRLPRRLRAMRADELPCPDGHPNPVMGRWTCGCGGTYAGHAFAPCPLCRMPAGWMRCVQCGLSIRSPWKDD